jgi:hypothetical protein
MKRLALLLILIVPALVAQSQIVNSGFENWYVDSTGKNRLAGWQHSVKYNYPNSTMFGTWRDANAEEGSYALKLSRWYNYTWDEVTQRSAIGAMPLGLSGFYRYTDNHLGGGQTNDTALIEMYLTAWNNTSGHRDTVAHGVRELSLSASYTSFYCPASSVSASLPDSMFIRIAPSKFLNSPGACIDSGYCSFLTVDNLSLVYNTGVAGSGAIICALSPNPSSGRMSVTVDMQHVPYQLSMVNMMGQTVYSAIISEPKQSIDISSLSAGVYSVILKDATGLTAIRKMVRQ